jgi:hypothetical protein
LRFEIDFYSLGGFIMVVIIGIAATVLFIILWRSGVLDDLIERGGVGNDGRWERESERLKEIPLDSEMAKRLEIFEEFMEELPDDEEE